jgi:hypothetical protein
MHRRLTVDGSYAKRPEVLVQARRTVGMNDDDEDDVVRQYELASVIDLREALTAAAIDFLDVDNERTIVIYQSAIIMLTATDGTATAARAFDAELWEPPAEEVGHEPAELLTTLVDELLTMTDASLIE